MPDSTFNENKEFSEIKKKNTSNNFLKNTTKTAHDKVYHLHVKNFLLLR